MDEVKRMGSAKNAVNMSEEDVFLSQTKTKDELRELGWKECNSCHEMRPDKLFYKSSKRNGLSYVCRPCHRKVVRNYRNVEGSYNYWYRRLEKMRTHARKRGLAFELTVDDFKDIKDTEDCYYCKYPMEVVSFDRKDNNIGYVRDNIVACCHMCNRLKSNIFTEDEMLIIGKAIHSYWERMEKLRENTPQDNLSEIISNL